MSHSESLDSGILNPLKNSAPLKAPGPKGHWFWGSLLERRRDPLRLFMNAALEYGDLVRFKMGPITVHLVANPELVKHVLQDNQKNYKKGFGYDKLEPMLGKGLLTSEGSFWHRQRKLAQPAFHRQRLEGFARTMVDSTVEMVNDWEKNHTDGKPFDVAKEMMKLTLTIVSRTLFSTEVASDVSTVGEAVSALIEESNKRILSIVHFTEKLPTPRNLKFARYRDALNSVVYRIIEERRKNPRDAGDLLSMFMMTYDEETGESMNNEQLRDEVMTIFLAGHETTANQLSWTWKLLSEHPQVRAKLELELNDVLGDRLPTFYDLPKLQYTLMVIEEALRLYPPVWVLSREAIGEDVVGGYPIPKGSIMILSPYVMQRHPKYWDNPEGFDPERFHPERKSADRPKYAYFPFSGGPRQCIGNNFALMESQLVLATIAQKFRLNLVPGKWVEVEPILTLRPKSGVWTTLQRR